MTVESRNRSKEWRSVPYNRAHMQRGNNFQPRQNYPQPQNIPYARAARGHQQMPPFMVFQQANVYQPPPFHPYAPPRVVGPHVTKPPGNMFNQSLPPLMPPPPPPKELNCSSIIVPPLTPNQTLDQSFPLLPTAKDVPILDCSMPLLPPPIREKANLPRFDCLYDEFDKMKKNGYIIHPKLKGIPPPPVPVELPKLPAAIAKPDSPSMPTPTGSDQDQCFAAAMQIFMQSYLPTACFQCTTPTEDWSKEAKALINNLEGLSSDETTSSMWPKTASSDGGSCKDVAITVLCATPERIAADSSLDKSNPASATGEDQQTVDIQRHLLEIKPSPYPSGSPVSSETSTKSAHSSDNDADDDVSSDSGSTAPPGGTIGRRLPCKKKKSERDECARIRLSLDSGYQSSSTEGSNINGYQGSAALDSDESTGDQRMSSKSSRDGDHISPYLSALLEAPWLKYQTSASSSEEIPNITEIKKSLSELSTSGACSDTNSTSSGSSSYPKHKAWITDGILDMIAVRDRLYKRMKKHPEPEIVELYKKVRNMVVGMTRNAKRLHEKRLDQQNGRSFSNDKRHYKQYDRRNKHHYSQNWKH